MKKKPSYSFSGSPGKSSIATHNIKHNLTPTNTRTANLALTLHETSYGSRSVLSFLSIKLGYFAFQFYGSFCIATVTVTLC